MDILYAPWRDRYVTKTKSNESDECVFCVIIANQALDEQNFVLKRTLHTITLLNLYPYNSGHLLILPLEHIATLAEVTPETSAQMLYMAGQAQEIFSGMSKAQGANVGFNIGAAAGAGIPQHIHMHFVPRWAGDTNFLPILAGAKQISVDLCDLYKKLKKEFDALHI